MRHIYILIFSIGFFLFPAHLSAQTTFKYDPVHPPNTFRSASSPYYWANRKPFEGYWQQDVHYSIKAEIEETTDIITASQKLTYWNNSPDTLKVVYFHLYQNAFQPGSYYHQMEESNGNKLEFGKYEAQGLGTVIDAVQQSDPENSHLLETELDNTILKVHMAEPIAPGGYAVFEMDFKTYFDNSSVERRMHWFDSDGHHVYKGVLWYPRIAVYDRKFGWHTDQHLSREFYGDIGTFDVELTFANDYVVEATGQLQNEAEMLPPDLMKKLDIKNFANKPWNEAPTLVLPRDSTVHKTWIYHAENVHDFGFTASPTYRIGKTKWKNVDCISLVQEQHAGSWQNAADFAAKCIEVFSEDFGLYGWNKIVVADAKDGMEYPMLTLDAGWDPQYRSLLAHEIGHMWFYGMVATNETYRAFLDEGFTQFLTNWGMEKIDGEIEVAEPYSEEYKAKYKKPRTTRQANIHGWFFDEAGTEKDIDMTTHSDAFDGYSYWHVYEKTAIMLYNLEQYLGKEKFMTAMRHYFKKWKFCHPYEEDMRQAFIESSGVDLNWFFDQWIDTKKAIDYKVLKPEKLDDDKYLLKLERVTDAEAPLEIVVTDNEDTKHHYYIPTRDFVKETQATVLPKWYGWNKINKTYETEISIPGGIADIEIDPSHTLADNYYLNNTLKKRQTLTFDHRLWNPADRYNYEWFWRPDVWYNRHDGLKVGGHINGNYLKKLHKWDITVWANTRLGRQDVDFPNDPVLEFRDPELFSGRIKYETPFSWHNNRKSSFFGELRSLDGVRYGKIGVKHAYNEHNELRAYVKAFQRFNLQYAINPSQWNIDHWNNTMNLEWFHEYAKEKHEGKWLVALSATVSTSDYNYSKLWFENVVQWKLGNKLPLRVRLFGQTIVGDNIAPESLTYLAGASPEELLENKYTRALGFVSENATGHGDDVNHFHHGGGMNLRGFSGYVVPESTNGEISTFFSGQHGFALNAELDFDELFAVDSPLNRYFGLDLYLFGDIGVINNNEVWAEVRADAGIGSALTVRKFGQLEMVKPLTIRFDIPLLLSHTPFVSPDFAQFRWVLGVERAF